MPTLSLDFTLTLNLRTGKMILHDATAYGIGVYVGITGVVSITQPDRITRTGDFAAADTFYTNGILQDAQLELRRDATGRPQQGRYSITYTVHHPDYSESTVTKTFTLRYATPLLSVSKNFDVFTPALLLQDVTDYAVDGFAVPTKTRAWSVAAIGVGIKTGTAAALDLILSGSYYDAAYAGTLAVQLSYASLTYAFLTVLDAATLTIKADAYAPPSYTQLKQYLSQIKLRFDALQDCRKTSGARNDFEYAAALLVLIKQRICAGDYVGLWSQIDDFMAVYYERVSPDFTHTNTAITAYSLADVDCGGGNTGGGSVGGTNVDSLTFTATGGEVAFSPAVGGKTLVGKNIIAVITLRATPMDIITTGTPGPTELKFFSSVGRIEVDASLPMEPGEKMRFIYSTP